MLHVQRQIQATSISDDRRSGVVQVRRDIYCLLRVHAYEYSRILSIGF